MIYKKKNLHFMIPLIIMSTVTGTANFAQSTFPEVIRPYVPQMIGAINLVSAIMTTIYQFLKIPEFMESHRITSINYGKFSRNITVELNLPIKNRSIGGNDLVKISRNDIDRLIEQSPSIPGKVIQMYKSLFSESGIAQPEILHINKVDIFHDQENKVTTALADAGVKFKKALFKNPPPPIVSNSPLAPVKERVGTLNKWENTIKELNSTFTPENSLKVIVNNTSTS
jgi:hypothetical protein